MTNYDYVEVPKPKESGFDLSYSNKLTMDFGDLVPVYKQEVLPSDEFKVKAQFMVRMAPLANPIFTKINAQIHYFFVPNRLLWNESKSNCWETFITGGKTGMETPEPPYFDIKGVFNDMGTSSDGGNSRGAQTLADYLGMPLRPVDYSQNEDDYDYKINALPFLAYQKIYDDWFRDANVTNSLFDVYEDDWLAGGAVGSAREALKIRRRCWAKDYFTSALPWAQRGQEVLLPTAKGFTATATLAGTDNGTNGLTNISGFLMAGTAASQDTGTIILNGAPTIRDLRNASALQLWLEKNAIGGARYIEQLLAHFGVYSEDARMQRAEYLGSVKSPVVISEVQSNAETEEAPLGKLGGKGISYGNDFAFDKKFTEHGWIIGVMSIMPEASYAQGMHRSLYSRETKLDYAFPEFAEIGLQQIDKCELFVAPMQVQNPHEVFGYNDRFGEYKSNYNEVHGFFKDDTSPMAQYNMTRFYSDSPTLSSGFLEVRETQITSPFVDTEKNKGNLWVDLYNDVKAIRPLPKNSLPLF